MNDLGSRFSCDCSARSSATPSRLRRAGVNEDTAETSVLRGLARLNRPNLADNSLPAHIKFIEADVSLDEANSSSTYIYLSSDYSDVFGPNLSVGGDWALDTFAIGNATLNGVHFGIAYISVWPGRCPSVLFAG